MIEDETILVETPFSPFVLTEQANQNKKNSEEYDDEEDEDEDDDDEEDDDDDDDDDDEVDNETYEIEISNKNFTETTLLKNTNIRHRQNTVESSSLKTTIFEQKNYQDLDSVHICITAEDDNEEAGKWLQLQDPYTYKLFERFQVFQGMDRTIVSTLTKHINFLEQKQKKKKDSKQKQDIQESELKLKIYKTFLLWCQQNLGKLGDSQILLQKCLTLFGQLTNQLAVESSLSANAKTILNKANDSLEKYLKAECNIYDSTQGEKPE